MYEIEYVVVQGQPSPLHIYRIDSGAYSLRAAEQGARNRLDSIRSMFPQNPPDGFQIFDDSGEIVLRSWEGTL